MSSSSCVITVPMIHNFNWLLKYRQIAAAKHTLHSVVYGEHQRTQPRQPVSCSPSSPVKQNKSYLCTEHSVNKLTRLAERYFTLQARAVKFP